MGRSRLPRARSSPPCQGRARIRWQVGKRAQDCLTERGIGDDRRLWHEWLTLKPRDLRGSDDTVLGWCPTFPGDAVAADISLDGVNVFIDGELASDQAELTGAADA